MSPIKKLISILLEKRKFCELEMGGKVLSMEKHVLFCVKASAQKFVCHYQTNLPPTKTASKGCILPVGSLATKSSTQKTIINGNRM